MGMSQLEITGFHHIEQLIVFCLFSKMMNRARDVSPHTRLPTSISDEPLIKQTYYFKLCIQVQAHPHVPIFRNLKHALKATKIPCAFTHPSNKVG
jgi:hypothetical protein